MNIQKLDDNYAVAAQIQPQDVVALAEAGFVAVICNRPDDEEPGQPAAADIAAACDAAGIAFHHVPVAGGILTPESAHQHNRIVDCAGGLVLGYCRSGQRSTVIYQPKPRNDLPGN